MAFLSTVDLKNLLSTGNCIIPYDPNRIDNVAYELALGDEVYLSDSKSGIKEILDTKTSQIQINPGQLALLLTKEIVNIPSDKLAFISIKASQKLKGLVNVSGFHVDPGFSGQLVFSVYNASPAAIMLERNEPYFLIWFTELSSNLDKEDAYNSKTNNHQNQSGIPVKYIEALKRGEITSPSALLNKIKEQGDTLKEKIKEVETTLGNQLKDVERKKLRNEWLLTLAIGASITLFIKFYWDSRVYQTGYEQGLKEKKVVEEVSRALDNLSIDSIVAYKVDSVLNNNFESQKVIKLPTKDTLNEKDE